MKLGAFFVIILQRYYNSVVIVISARGEGDESPGDDGGPVPRVCEDDGRRLGCDPGPRNFLTFLCLGSV